MEIKKVAKTIWRGILQPFKWHIKRLELIIEKPIVIGVLLFILIGFFVVSTTLERGESYEGEFIRDLEPRG